jgi:hypothetical protein
MSPTTAPQPPLQGSYHVGLTVPDVDAAAVWYERVRGLHRIPAPFPHHGSEKTGYAAVLMDADIGITIGLHYHDGNDVVVTPAP